MSKVKKVVLFLGDLTTLYLSLGIALLLRYKGDFYYRLEGHVFPFSIIFILWLIVFYISDLYQDKVLRNENSIIQSLTWATLISGVISVLAFYLFGDFFSLTPKTNLAVFSLSFLVLDYLWRILVSKIFSSGAWGVGILGDSPLIEKTIKHLNDHPHTGYKVIEWRKEVSDKDFIEMTELILANKLQFLIVQPRLIKDPKILNAVYRLLPLEANVMNFSYFYELIFGKVPLDELEEQWFVDNITTRKKVYDASKGIIDFVFSVFFSVLFLPFAVVFALIIKLTSRGPIIFSQKRIGKNGEIFTLYKFRTMEADKNGPLWTEDNDSRITAFGKFLRFTHMDELPQLWNILKGDISVTGPRPERVELVEQYQKFPYYEIRHIVKPGLTGWAQINFKPSASLEEAKEKLEYDIYYVKNRSFILDALTILKTLKYIFTGTK